MREALANYVKRVRELAEYCRGNEQATKSSLIAPLFALLGYDPADPRECFPEYRADFGPGRSKQPMDWAFLANGTPIFFVEAKEIGKKLPMYDEQLADYFAKVSECKLGILTNGVQWRFFTDAVAPNIMDKQPFAVWDVLGEDAPPYDVLTVIQKPQFNPELIRAYAQSKHRQSLLVVELTRLLEPSPEFTKLAIASLESRNLTTAVVEGWRTIVAGAVDEWARQRTLTAVLGAPKPGAAHAAEDAPPPEPTPEELEAWAIVQQALGTERPVEFERTINYFKVHLPGQRTCTVLRLTFQKRRRTLTVPLTPEQVQPFAAGLTVSPPQSGWCSLTLNEIDDLRRLADILKLAWDAQKASRGKNQKPSGAADAVQI